MPSRTPSPGRHAPSRGRDSTPVPASMDALRRLAVVKQRLAGPSPTSPSKDSLLSLVRDLAYVQWDPVTVVAPSHVLSVWARLGRFRLADLDDLLWKERKLVQHWIPFAAIVLTEDYPLYGSLMRRYPDSLSKSWGRQRDEARRFLDRHADLRRRVVRELRKGPRTVRQFEDHARTPRNDGVWGSASDVSLLLYYLLMRGEVMVVGHEGAQNVWGLVETNLPAWSGPDVLSAEDAENAAAERAIRVLGSATAKEVQQHFVRGCYLDLPGALARLHERGLIHPVAVEGGTRRSDVRYVHDQDLPLLTSLTSEAPEPRVTLLPPFDNMVYSQQRLQRLFGFDYIREQFFPKEKRRYGTYVLPILRGDRFIGRIDPRLDKEGRTLVVNAVHAEPSAPRDRSVAREVAATIEDLAQFLGAEKVTYTSHVPEAWRSAFR